MKKIIAISVVFALVAGAAFAETTLISVDLLKPVGISSTVQAVRTMQEQKLVKLQQPKVRLLQAPYSWQVLMMKVSLAA